MSASQLAAADKFRFAQKAYASLRAKHEQALATSAERAAKLAKYAAEDLDTFEVFTRSRYRPRMPPGHDPSSCGESVKSGSGESFEIEFWGRF